MEADAIGLPDSLLERGTFLRGSPMLGRLQTTRTGGLSQPLTTTDTLGGSNSLSIGHRGSEQSVAHIDESQSIARAETDRRDFESKTDVFPLTDLCAVKDTMDGYLPTLGQAEFSKNLSHMPAFQLKSEDHELADDLSFPQSPLASPTLSATEVPSSPSTTLADDESLSSALTLVDSFLLESRTFGPTESMGSILSETKVNVNPPSPPLDAHVSLGTVLRGKGDNRPQKIEPPFTDPTGYYYNTFGIKLQVLNAKNSETSLCIDSYLAQSEAEWFDRVRGFKLGKPRTRAPSSLAYSQNTYRHLSPGHVESLGLEYMNRIAQEDGQQTAKGLRRVLLLKIGDWPVYSLLIALGQILAVSSYNTTLITGELGQSDMKFYAMSSVYVVACLFWWLSFRTFKSVYILAAPFAFYGLAFFFVALAPLAQSTKSTRWVQNVATGLYAIASSSGGFYFALNFANERTIPVAKWSFQACVIQGSQQIYLVMLWYWGLRAKKGSTTGAIVSTAASHSSAITKIAMPIALLMWMNGIALLLGLPEYFWQAPLQIPSFYRSITRRKTILWFFVAIIIQSYFLNLPYSHNWRYLWSSKHAPPWTIALLVLIIFIGVWTALLALFGKLSTWHPWIVPIFAVGVGAPRWAQILWSTSNMGSWIPWAATPLGGALVGRALWLWLGVLDAIQLVGFGMILLQTLTRLYVAFAVVCTQILGTIATIAARASSPPFNGPAGGSGSGGGGAIFPNFAVDGIQGLRSAWFWTGLLLQLCVCAGFFKFFRKEQLQKP